MPTFAVAAALLVERNDVINDLDYPLTEERCLIRIERVADEDKSITTEDLDGSVDL